jgi:hypothetical protein
LPPGRGSVEAGGSVLGTQKRRIAHGTSLMCFLIFCNKLQNLIF